MRSVVGVLLLLSGLLLVAPQASAATTVKVLQLNICHSGYAGCYTGAEPVMAKAVSVITANKPQVLSVNEACSGDVARLQSAMGDSRAVFVAAQTRDGACHANRVSQRCTKIDSPARRSEGTPSDSGHIVSSG